MQWSERPVIVIGHGCRLAGADLMPILSMNVPILSSWPAADLIDSDHTNYFGRPGAYGQRCANKVLANADLIVAVGCRLSIWTVGHDFPRPGQSIAMVDCDVDEVTKFRTATHLGSSIPKFIASVAQDRPQIDAWRAQCAAWRAQYPWLETPTHEDARGYVNPHRFMANLQPHLRPDEIITADCATGSLAAHQILRLKPPQRLMTSGGLGEMGCGLPAAIGASFATNKGRVICLTSDGGIMLTLQELATVAHHRLPIKIALFCNDGYGMIKDTQRTLGYQRTGVDRASGISFPTWGPLAQSFGLHFDWGDYSIERWLGYNGPAILQIDTDPDYFWGPKLRPGKNADGSIKHADFAEMSPSL